MNTRTKRLLWIGGGALGAIVIAGFALWFFVLRSDAPDPVSIDDAVAAVTSTTAASTTTAAEDETTTTTAAPSTTTTTAAPTPAGIEGNWAVVDSNRSFAGYRVEEELASIGFTTAAGRTPDVEATLVIDGTTVTEAAVEIDTTTLQSDSSRRDGAIRSQALETDLFPTAGFVLAEPIELPAEADSGNTFNVDAVGDLTLHGVTNRVTIPLAAAFVDDTVVVVGSLLILFEDYDIEQPRAGVVLSVEDNGIMEFQLFFERA